MRVPPFSLEKQLSEIGQELEEAVLRVLHSGQYIGGEEVKSFEDSFSKIVGTNYSVGCNSGTDALILALRSLDIGIGDEVITSSFTFFATAEAISNVGAKPVFVDVDPKSYLIDLDLIEKSITKETKAILPVHMFGQSVDMEKLMDIADRYGLKVIEDCAQAAGAKWNDKSVGSWGDLGCFSFFPTKNLGAGGDAGVVATSNEILSKRIRQLSVHGMPQRYVHTELGYNSRLDALQAAILNVKLPKLSKWVKQRDKVALRYQECLKDLPGLELPQVANPFISTHAWNQFVVKVGDYSGTKFLTNEKFVSEEPEDVSAGLCRDWLKKNLEELGVRTIIYYPIPIHLQPAYKNLGYGVGSLPLTEKLSNQVLSLPIYPELSEPEQDYVVASIKKLLKKLNPQELASSMPSSNGLSV
tara:strand:- start:1135 stop:2376 length:1242 start_codon:yes stop_codon:yes gene_type:complete